MIKNEIFMKIAEDISQASYCERKKVGAIIVKDGNIISMWYNGTPSGFENSCEYKDREDLGIPWSTRPEVLHAESNAIAKCAKSTHSCQDWVLYVTLSPCFECAKIMIQSGIKEVYYRDQYRENDWIELLKKAGIICYQI